MTQRLLSLFLLFSFAVNGQVVRNQYYFLQRPTSNIFTMAFGQPSGKSDPIPAPSSCTISDDDLRVENSTFSESFYTTKDNSSSYLFSSWNKVKGVSVTGKFSKVKHVLLKNDAWQKIGDNLFHVVEALRADTVELKIRKDKDDSATSNVFQKIASLFVADYTVVGKVLTTLGNDSIAAGDQSKSSIVKLKFKSKDSISLLIIDSTVYYAVRYAKVDPSKANVVKILGFRTNKMKAPECAPDPSVLTIEKDLTSKTIQTLMPECKINNALMSAKFVYDPSNQISNVFITRKRANQIISRTSTTVSPRQIIDTVYISEFIDFTNEYKDEPFEGNYQFVANENPNTTSIENIVAICDFKISFNTETKKLSITNFDRQYQTCFYFEKAKIRYFPK